MKKGKIVHYISTRGRGEYTFTEAMRLGRAPDGGYFLPGRLPDFDWASFCDLDADSRALKMMEAFCPDLELNETIEILALAFNPEAFPFGIYHVDRLNAYNDKRLILELDRGASGFLHDHGLALHLAFAQKLELYPKKQPLLSPFAEEQRAFDAWRRLQPEAQRPAAIFLKHQAKPRLDYATQVEGDRHLNLSGQRAELSFLLQDLPAELSEQIDSLDGSSPAYLLAAMIILASSLADLAKKEEFTEGPELLIPVFNLTYLLAALYLKSMAVPLGKILLVSAQNHALTDFIRTGKISLRRRFLQSEADEMDRLLPANFEKLIFELSGRDLELSKNFMQEVKEKKQAKFERDLVKGWSEQLDASYATERRAKKLREKLYHETDYLLDSYSLIALAGLEHLKKYEQRQILLLLCGRPWKGYKDSPAELEKLAKEAGVPLNDYCLSQKESVEDERLELGELKDLLLSDKLC